MRPNRPGIRPVRTYSISDAENPYTALSPNMENMLTLTNSRMPRPEIEIGILPNIMINGSDRAMIGSILYIEVFRR